MAACSFPGSGSRGENGPILDDSVNKEVLANTSTGRVDTGFILTGPESYDSADTPVVVDIDEEKDTITFLNLDIGRRYTLSMDGTTKLSDKYGDSISLKQLQKGDIVDVTFLKSKKRRG